MHLLYRTELPVISYIVLLMLIVDPFFCIFSISAQSNFAVGAVVNATFGSITELTFYITALLRSHQGANPCLQEVVKAALTGTLLGCILFIPVRQPALTSHFTFLKSLTCTHTSLYTVYTCILFFTH